ncbi:MAG: DUF2630 family protein [Acidimicrobiales bacterium]|jgi:hypothetical protein
MDDNEVIARIGALVDEEHRLESSDPNPPDQERIRELEIALDQCWDLLRQRRARREAGQDPDQAHSRTEGTVEGYQQ